MLSYIKHNVIGSTTFESGNEVWVQLCYDTSEIIYQSQCIKIQYFDDIICHFRHYKLPGGNCALECLL